MHLGMTDSQNVSASLVESIHLMCPIEQDNNTEEGQDTDSEMIAINSLGGSTTPNTRIRVKRRLSETESPDFEVSVKQMLFSVNRMICQRLEELENKLDAVSVAGRQLEEKVENLHVLIKETNNQTLVSGSGRRSGTVIVGIPQNSTSGNHGMDNFEEALETSQHAASIGPNVTLITLNTEEDYPNGSWLGDENNPEMRVRCHITSLDMLHINNTCPTAEKMALTLLDYLFDRETQATSNISGLGKHKKKQLDPLMIYGIRCHLIHKFGITEKDWHRIKQNMDSKCRTAYRRKLRGLPLTVKAFRDKATPTYIQLRSNNSNLSHSDDSLQQESDAAELSIQSADLHVEQPEVAVTMATSQVIQTQHGPIQVLTATPEQLAQIQQLHQIQILTGEQIIHEVQTHDESEIQSKSADEPTDSV